MDKKICGVINKTTITTLLKEIFKLLFNIPEFYT